MRFRGLLALAAVTSAIPANGWNDNVEWMSLAEGLRDARKSSRPIMTLIHMSWCAACKALKPQFAKSAEIGEMAKHFTMVLAGDSDEPKEAKFRPEGLKGGYYPRIIFLKPDGSRIEGIKGPNEDYSAYFSKPAQIVGAMREALKAVGVDPEAARKARMEGENAAKAAATKAYQDTVPSILKSIFEIVDADKNEVLSHTEFSSFAQHTRGAVPTEAQYEKVCAMHKSPGGLTFEKMVTVYSSRPADELKDVYKKIMTAYGKKAEL